jgi:ADP-ribosyl-[dinitrogen reductase] hydrolase
MLASSSILGSLWGSLVGDALGVPVEFQSRQDRRDDPVKGMRGFGTHFQPPGTWSDDGALLLCSVESLVECRGFDTQDMVNRFVHWERDALWTATGCVFDIGNATSRALGNAAYGTPPEQCGGTHELDNGNGSLMRILPISLFATTVHDDTAVSIGSALTHGHSRSRLACQFHSGFVRVFSRGLSARDAFQETQIQFEEVLERTSPKERRAFQRILQPDFSQLPECSISSNGYVIDTLESSFWCLLNYDTFRESVLKAVNLGSDADTTGCVTGGLAGLVHGIESIPSEWLDALPMRSDLDSLFDGFIQLLT